MAHPQEQEPAATPSGAALKKDLRREFTARIPEQSFLFDKVIPASLAGLAILAAGLILFALGVLLGWVSF